jgi:1-acyl-sn-glycerol-3-phosphate acyltransferase
MIFARKSKIFEQIFSLYNRNLFQRRFHRFSVAGLENLVSRNKQIPLILYANHSSWWDGLVAFEIGRKARLDHFVLMEEKQLKNLFLFKYLGAFSVVRETPREAVRSINYAVDLLKEKENRALWIFPQGEILPNDIRPLRFFNGIGRIIEKLENCYVAPVAMRYEHLGNFKPEVLARIGRPEEFGTVLDRKFLTEQLSEELTNLLEQVKTNIVENEINDYKTIF